MIDGRRQIVAIPQRDHHPLTRFVIEHLMADGEADQIIVFDNDTKAVNGIRWVHSVEDGLYGDLVEVRHRSGNGVIYAVWNEAWRLALDGCRDGALVDLTILNNDITPPEGMIGHLSRALRDGVLPDEFRDLEPPDRAAPEWKPEDDVMAVFPDYRINIERPVEVADPPRVTPTLGTWRKKGLSGFCFMFAPEIHTTRGVPFIDEKFRWLCGDGDLIQQIQFVGGTAARVEGLPLGFQVRTSSSSDRNKKWVSDLGHKDLAYSRRKFTKGGSFPTWRKRWGSAKP